MSSVKLIQLQFNWSPPSNGEIVISDDSFLYATCRAFCRLREHNDIVLLYLCPVWAALGTRTAAGEIFLWVIRITKQQLHVHNLCQYIRELFFSLYWISDWKRGGFDCILMRSIKGLNASTLTRSGSKIFPTIVHFYAPSRLMCHEFNADIESNFFFELTRAILPLRDRASKFYNFSNVTREML